MRMKKCLFFIAIIAFLSCLLIRAGAQTNQHIKSGDATIAVNFPAGGCVYNWTNTTPGIGLAASGTGNIPSFTGTNTGTSALTATITGTPASSDFAYIANSGSNNVSVISTLSNTVIATIPVGTTPFGVSVNPNSTLVYITNQGSNNVSVINTLTNMVTATIPVGQTPTGVVVSPDGSRVYVTNAGDNTVSIIDASTNAQTGIINVGASPYGIAITPDGNKLYVANYNSNTISAINISAGNAVTVIPAQSYPFGIAISPDGTRAYVSNSGIYTITAINTADNSVVGNLSAFTNPTGLVVGADDNTIYFVTADGYLCTYNILTNFRTSVRATGRAYSLAVAANGYAYIVDNINGFVEYSDFNGGSGGAITVGSLPYSLGNFIAKGPSCGAPPVTFTITVDPPPHY